MNSDDELDQLLRRPGPPSAGDPDGGLGAVLGQLQMLGCGASPTPSGKLSALLLADAPVAGSAQAAPASRPVRAIPVPPQNRRRWARPGRRTSVLLARLAAVAPTMKILLAGSAMAATVTVSAVVADLPGSQPRPARVITPAVTTGPTPDSPRPTTHPTSSHPTSSHPTNRVSKAGTGASRHGPAETRKHPAESAHGGRTEPTEQPGDRDDGERPEAERTDGDHSGRPNGSETSRDDRNDDRRRGQGHDSGDRTTQTSDPAEASDEGRDMSDLPARSTGRRHSKGS
jgi:hypothetical protein